MSGLAGQSQVAPGDVWRVGPHILACGDLDKGDGPRLIAFGVPLMKDIKTFYSDPPWNLGLAKAFRTKAGLSSDETEFVELMARVLELAASVRGDVWIEMGHQHAKHVAEWMKIYNIPWFCNFDITYADNKPCALVYGTFSQVQPFVIPAHLRGEKIVEWALSRGTLPGDVVLDPCLGLGMTTRVAHKLNLHVLGMELHPERLARSIDDLARLGKYEPVKIGVLK